MAAIVAVPNKKMHITFDMILVEGWFWCLSWGFQIRPTQWYHQHVRCSLLQKIQYDLNLKSIKDVIMTIIFGWIVGGWSRGLLGVLRCVWHNDIITRCQLCCLVPNIYIYIYIYFSFNDIDNNNGVVYTLTGQAWYDIIDLIHKLTIYWCTLIYFLLFVTKYYAVESCLFTYTSHCITFPHTFTDRKLPWR